MYEIQSGSLGDLFVGFELNGQHQEFVFCSASKEFCYIFNKTMSSSRASRYRKGVNRDLDRSFERYQRMRIWKGDSYRSALTEEEIDTMHKLWSLEKLTP